MNPTHHGANFCPNCGCDMKKVGFALGLAARMANGERRVEAEPAPAAITPRRRVRALAAPPKTRTMGEPHTEEERQRARTLRSEGKSRAESAAAMGISINRLDALLYPSKNRAT